MEKHVRCMEVKDGDERVILSLYLYPGNGMVLQEKPGQSSRKAGAREESGEGGSQQNDGTLMTDAQKRFLFRLMADKGMEGDEAYDYLKSLFQVDTLKEVTKIEASRTIEQLLAEAKGGDGDGPPF